MGDGEQESDTSEHPTPPTDVQIRTTRRPAGRRGRRRRVSLGRRFKDLGAPFELGVDGLADVPVIGPIVLGVVLALFAFFLFILLGALLLALIEILILAALAGAAALVAWLRQHPKVTILDVDGTPWIRDDGASATIEHARQVKAGTDPADLGYSRATALPTATD